MSLEIKTGPDPVDIEVGSKIRARRKQLGRSQEWLAAALGLTFQQVQKYERGSNRVSASKLYQIAQALKCSIAAFFPDAGDQPELMANIAGVVGMAYRIDSSNSALLPALAQLNQRQHGDLTRIIVHMLPEPVQTAELADIALQARSADPVNREAA